jgi:uncharacterized protein YqfA (UPF0365 family)
MEAKTVAQSGDAAAERFRVCSSIDLAGRDVMDCSFSLQRLLQYFNATREKEK